MAFAETEVEREPSRSWHGSLRQVGVVRRGELCYLASYSQEPGQELTSHDIEMLESTGAEIVEVSSEPRPTLATVPAAEGGWGDPVPGYGVGCPVPW